MLFIRMIPGCRIMIPENFEVLLILGEARIHVLLNQRNSMDKWQKRVVYGSKRATKRMEFFGLNKYHK